MRKFHSLLLLLCLFVPACNADWMFVREEKQNTDVDVVTPVQPVEFRCLILEETAQRTRLTSGQVAILTGKLVSDFMSEHCVKDKNGKPEFRVYDKDLKLTGPWLVVTQKNPPQSYPWFYCTNGRKGTNGPLPKSKDAPEKFIQLLNPFVESK